MAADWKGLLGGESTIRQLFLWGVAVELVHQVIAPMETELQQQIWAKFPTLALDPATAADMAARGIATPDEMEAEAAAGGINADRFARLTEAVLGAVPADQLAAAYRLGILPGDAGEGEASVDGGVKLARLRPEWWPIVQQLALQWPSAEMILNAYLEGQVDEATARAEYAKLGGVAEYFDLLYNTQGSAPTPEEALTLANRGIIPWTGTGAGVVSYEQAFLEGPWRNKWESSFRALGEYLPPPRTVVTMLRNGSLDIPTATTLLEHQGLIPSLADAYIADATTASTAVDKAATESTVVTLYREGGITEDEAKTLLGALGYTDAAVGFILASADLQRGLAALNSVISRIGTYFIAHKLTPDAAATALRTLDLPADQITTLIQTWTVAQAANLKLLTESQIADAWAYGILDQAAALVELEGLGYTAHDAWTVLSVKNKAPLPNEPATS